jgi:hypothetical protein
MTYPYELKAFHMQKEITKTPHSLSLPSTLIGTLKKPTAHTKKGFIVPLFNEDMLLHDYHLH